MDKFKKSRVASFSAVTLIYIAATVVGILVYRILPMSWWLALLVADVVATVFVFGFSVALGNASVYDPYWSVQPPVIIAAFAVGQGLTELGVLVTAAIALWAVRLTANWAYTFGNLTHQDWRYTMLKEKTGSLYPIVNFVGIHMVPTLVVWGCVLPAVHAIREELSANTGSILFIGLSVLAMLMQGVSDVQMHSYRQHRDTPFNRRGLWKYSRHPNYLGEILMWWGIALAVVCADPDAAYLCLGALANTLLFLLVSIPLADGRQSRKEGFAEYKAETRMLLPIPKLSRK